MRAFLFAVSLGLLMVGVSVAADSLKVRLVGSCDTPGYAHDAVLMSNYVFVADGDLGLRVISVANPTHPVEVGHTDTPGGGDVAVIGDCAYVADGESGLRVISISDPTHPRLKSGPARRTGRMALRRMDTTHTSRTTPMV
jgi:hypothetical protein